MTKVVDVYVKLLAEGVDVWRPVRATHLGDAVYRLADGVVPAEEQWEFAPGDVVICRQRKFADSVALAATELSAEDPGTVRTWLEFHDSSVARVTATSNGTIIEVQPGYLHRWERRSGARIGTGWLATVSIRLTDVVVDEALANAPSGSLSGGHVATPAGVYDNLVPLPLFVTGAVGIELIGSNGIVWRATAGAISVDRSSDGTFVEALPADLDPERS